MKPILKRTLKLFWISGLVFLGMAAALGIYMVILAQELPSLEQLEHYTPRLATTLLSSDGQVIKELFIQRRLFTPLEQIPHDMIDAVIVTEDRRFEKHWGLNLGRIFRSILIDVATLSFKQGASTLTQQLARNLYLSPEKKISRKLKETMTAIQIERTYAKEEIMEMYLTQAYFGHGAYGIEAAARCYFSKSAAELTLDECALLVAQLKAPSHYSPFFHPESALSRRNLILKFMFKRGVITEAEYQEAFQKEIKVVPKPIEGDLGTAPYFTEMVRIELETLGAKLGFDYYKDGLTIHTTLDSRLQSCADAAMTAQLNKLQREHSTRISEQRLTQLLKVKYPKFSTDELKDLAKDRARVDTLLKEQLRVQSAFVALDPATGKILALIGGRSFTESKFNRAVQAIRQPGSAFKPFAYTAAIDNGFKPSDQLLNQPVSIEQVSGQIWSPQNYDLSTSGKTTLREALKKSLNLVAVRVVQEMVKPSDVVRYAHQMGINTKLDAVDAIALGSCGVIPIELTAAYGVFANHGVWCEPYAISKIVNHEGHVIYENNPKRKVALSEQTAYVMTDMLRDVVDHGTGAAIRSQFGFTRPAAGKTGTTNDYTDAWFVGFTPQIVACVWVGLDDPAMSLGPAHAGSRDALPIWARFMVAAYNVLDWKIADFAAPNGVVTLEVCAESHELATELCPRVVNEVFRVSDVPTKFCPLHARHAPRSGWRD